MAINTANANMWNYGLAGQAQRRDQLQWQHYSNSFTSILKEKSKSENTKKEVEDYKNKKLLLLEEDI